MKWLDEKLRDLFAKNESVEAITKSMDHSKLDGQWHYSVEER